MFVKKIECSQIFTFLPSNDKIAVQKNNLGGKIWYRSLGPVKNSVIIINLYEFQFWKNNIGATTLF